MRRQLAWPPGCRLTFEQVYDLILAETEDPAQASKAASGYAAALLRNNLPIE